MSSLNECQVVSMRRFDGPGKLKAFADLRIGGALVLKSCAVFEGKNGIFAKLPQQIGTDGKWWSVVDTADEKLRQKYQKSLVEAYESKNSKGN